MDFFAKRKVNITIKDPVPILQTKILIVGNSGVGKSTILETLISKSDNKNKNKEKTFAVDIVRHKIKFTIWDFSGKNEFSRIRSEFYSESNGIIYVFDLNDENSFHYLEYWLKECKKYYGEKLITLLIGNKSDLKANVSTSDIERFCNQYKLSYYEVHGFNYDSVDKCFRDYANMIVELMPKTKR